MVLMLSGCVTYTYAVPSPSERRVALVPFETTVTTLSSVLVQTIDECFVSARFTALIFTLFNFQASEKSTTFFDVVK